jgi:hypothetical protein
MSSLTPLKVAEYRDERAKVIAPATVIHELAYFSAIINHAEREVCPVKPNRPRRISSCGTENTAK